MRYIDLHFPSFSGFFALFWCRSNVGRCRSFANLSQKAKIFLRSIFCTAVFSLVTVGDGHFHTFYIEKKFYFFSRVRKVYIWVSPTVTSQFFGLFCPFFVTVGDGRFLERGAKPTKIKEKACGRWQLTFCQTFIIIELVADKKERWLCESTPWQTQERQSQRYPYYN